nr:hypothetical protein [Propionibacterium sp.]
MADDLAARISEGAVAVLDLVPGEQRFHDLSRFVLRGGASRFAAVVLDDEPVRYVLPVGVPGRKLDYGTLLIQRSRCALVWRTDPARPYHAKIAALGPDTTVSQSPVTIRGEVWGRFDLRSPDGPTMTFLVPPVAATALPRMLHRVLVEEPRSRLAYVEAPPLPPAVTEGAAEHVPTAVDPDAPTEALKAAALRSDSEALEPAPPVEAGPAPTIPAAAEPEPALVEPIPEPPVSEWAESAAADESAAAAEFGLNGTSTAVDTYDSLYRTTERVSPPPAPPEPATPAPTVPPEPATKPAVDAVYRPVRPVATPVPPPSPDAAAGSPVRTAGAPAPLQAAPPQTAPPVDRPADVPAPGAAPLPPERSQLGDGWAGFLIGLVVTLVIGGLFVLAKVLGWLG